MLLRYSHGKCDIASLDEARILLNNQPQHFSITTKSPTTGMLKVRYLELTDDGQFIDSYSSELVSDTDLMEVKNELNKTQ